MSNSLGGQSTVGRARYCCTVLLIKLRANIRRLTVVVVNVTEVVEPVAHIVVERRIRSARLRVGRTDLDESELIEYERDGPELDEYERDVLE